jgi:hypothetical protein
MTIEDERAEDETENELIVDDEGNYFDCSSNFSTTN